MEQEYAFFLPELRVPQGFAYPNAYLKYAEETPDLEPWHPFWPSGLQHRFDGLKTRYPSHSLVPFARRGDNDDVACFDASSIMPDPQVMLIHDFASPGWELRNTFKNFNEWLVFAAEESAEWKKWQNENSKVEE